MVRQNAYVHETQQQQRTSTIRIKVTRRERLLQASLLKGYTLTHTLFCYTHKLSTWSFLSISHSCITQDELTCTSIFCTIANASIYRHIYACILHTRPSLGREFHKSSLFHAQCFHATLMHALPFQSLQPTTTPIYTGCSLAFQQMHVVPTMLAIK